MDNSKMPPLPARFDIRGSERIWRCGVRGCEGRLGYVVEYLDGGPEPGEPNYDGPFLWLPDNYEKRADGTYRKTHRSAQRSPVGKRRIGRARSGSTVFFSVDGKGNCRTLSEPEIESHLQRNAEEARRRDGHRTYVLDNKELRAEPARVCCPGCGRLSIISSVTGTIPVQ